MARVFTAKAGKDYPEKGIRKGETYYYWTPGFRGTKQMSKTPPRPSQLTTSKMSGALAAAEQAEDVIGDAQEIEAIAEALREAASEINSVADEYEEVANAEAPNGNRLPQADEMQEKADGLREWSEQLEQDADEVEALDVTDYVNDETKLEALPDELVVENDAGEKVRKKVEEFDDLTDEEKESMLSDARDTATVNIGCPL